MARFDVSDDFTTYEFDMLSALGEADGLDVRTSDGFALASPIGGVLRAALLARTVFAPIERAQTGSYPGDAKTSAGDTIPGNVTTTEILAVGGSQTGYVNVPGDDDWFRVELVAGQSYVFTSNGTNAAGGIALEDPYLELYNSAGVLIAIDDDAGPGRNALLRFTAVQSGTYYINARAWEPDAGPELTGGYQLAVNIGAPQNPLDTIDLQFTAPLHIDVYFATAGQIFDGATAFRSWTQAEINSAMNALATYSAVANLTFAQTNVSGNAEFILFISDLDPNVLGQFHTTGGVGYGEFAHDGTGWTAPGLQPGGLGWVTLIHEFGHGLGLGHPHDNTIGPFNNDPGDEIMQGVVDPFDSYGTFLMNQGVFTTMSYNDGWASVFGLSPVAFGNQATPMALDLGLLQQLYGANLATNSGNTTYTLPSANAAGTFFSSIWDANGVDTIQAGSSTAATIDLRSATLLNEIGGGGFVSSHANIEGGFTIAAGALIENARGGGGADTLIGNSAANLLEGQGGDDSLIGGGGDDSLVGGAGNDSLNGGAGVDRAWYADAPGNVEVSLALDSVAQDTGHGVDTLSSIEVVFGSNFHDTLIGSSGNDTLIGLGGFDLIAGGAGADWLVGGDGNDQFAPGVGGGVDRLFGGTPDADSGSADIIDYTVASAGVVVQLSGYATSGGTLIATFSGIENAFGTSFNDALIGNAASNRIIGGAGDDWIVGGAGDDILVQFADNAGVDRLFGDDGSDEIVWSSASVGVIVQLSGGYATTSSGTLLATFSGIENVMGTQLNDALIGDGAANRIANFWGADWLVGGGGDDLFVMYADANVDRIFGDSGFDTIDYFFDDAGVIIQLSGYATTNDAARTLLATFTGIEAAIGTHAADALIGNGADNRLIGDNGADWLVGGAGADDFVYRTWEAATRDTIADFSRAQGDIIDLNALDANILAAGDQNFVFSLTRTPGLAGEAVAIATSATTALVSLYMNTDNIADMTIAVIHDGVALGQDDFVL